ncbi:hypothetical protein [Kushneria indalinina]|uniref:Uncharacterized protein n=1 Tax=Kushneria indalinina DSM 14324 TaxID=1122140 RepID=A0A3D9DZC0_9GAMM|nr:hypothetical protein [Kushneria indalinina]REC95995.1 hypothetical protein C8D72_0667 [Kushneria indalinina DSM 14324]
MLNNFSDTKQNIASGVTSIIFPKIDFFPVMILSSSHTDHSYTTTKQVRDITSDIKTPDGEGVSIKSFHHRDERQIIRYKNLLTQKEGVLKLNNESIDVFEKQKLCLGVDSRDGYLEVYHNYNTGEIFNMGRSLITNSKEKEFSKTVAIEGFLVGAIPLLNILGACFNPLILRGKTNTLTEQNCYKGLYIKLFLLWILISCGVVLAGYLNVEAGFLTNGKAALIALLICGILSSITSIRVLEKYTSANWGIRRSIESQLHKAAEEFNRY